MLSAQSAVPPCSMNLKVILADTAIRCTLVVKLVMMKEHPASLVIQAIIIMRRLVQESVDLAANGENHAQPAQ